MGTSTNDLVKQVARCVDSNPRATLTVKEIAAAMKSDPAGLDRAFRHSTGKTIKHYIDEKYKEKIDDCLKAGDCRGYEIGDKLGFKSDLAFYRWVKRVYGIPFRQLKLRKRVKWGKNQGRGETRQSNDG